MSTLGTRKDQEEPVRKEGGHGGHSHWLMMACCVPMLVIAIVLVVSGVVGAGAILFAVMCAGMMGLMMIGMSRGSGQS